MAVTDAAPQPKRGEAYRLYFQIRKENNELVTGWTSPSADVLTDTTASTAEGTPTEVGSTGFGYIDLSATEMDGSVVGVKVSVTNKGAVDYVAYLYPKEAGDVTVSLDSVGEEQAADIRWGGYKQVIYVDDGGSDTTGNGGYGNPYATLEKAATEATSGTLVVVRHGSYNVSASIARDGVDWYFEANALVTSSVRLFDQQTAGESIVSTIRGRGRFDCGNSDLMRIGGVGGADSRFDFEATQVICSRVIVNGGGFVRFVGYDIESSDGTFDIIDDNAEVHAETLSVVSEGFVYENDGGLLTARTRFAKSTEHELITSVSGTGYIIVDAQYLGVSSSAPVIAAESSQPIVLTGGFINQEAGDEEIVNSGPTGFVVLAGMTYDASNTLHVGTGTVIDHPDKAKVNSISSSVATKRFAFANPPLADRIRIIRGDAYDGDANPAFLFDMNKSVDGKTCTMTIRRKDTDEILLEVTDTGDGNNARIRLTSAETDIDVGTHKFDVSVEIDTNTYETPALGDAIVYEDQTR